MAEIEAKRYDTPEPPLSISQASVDDKGRLKLPSEHQEYLEAIGVKRVFITTLDLRIARIYPIEAWKANEKMFGSAGENAQAAQRLAFLAKAYGGEADIDKSGRVLLPAKLRETLELEKQAVWLESFSGRINLMTKKVYDERMQLSLATMLGDLETLEKAGLL